MKFGMREKKMKLLNKKIKLKLFNLLKNFMYLKYITLGFWNGEWWNWIISFSKESLWLYSCIKKWGLK